MSARNFYYERKKQVRWQHGSNIVGNRLIHSTEFDVYHIAAGVCS